MRLRSREPRQELYGQPTVRRYRGKLRGGAYPSPSGGGGARAIPAAVTTKNLLTAWNTQYNSGARSANLTKVWNTGQGLTDLQNAGWIVDTTNKQVFFTVNGSVSGIDFTGAETFVRNNAVVTFTDCKWSYGASTGSRILNFDSGTNAWVATFNFCTFDGLNQTGSANGIIVGPAAQGGQATFNDCRFQNAQRAYLESGSLFAYNRCYFAPVCAWGTLNDGVTHGEHIHSGGGTDTLVDCMMDQVISGTAFNPLTGLVFVQGVNAIANVNCTTCVFIGNSTYAPPLPWICQVGIAGSGATVFNGFWRITNCVVDRGSSGYCTSQAGGFVPTTSLNINTGATITDGTTP